MNSCVVRKYKREDRERVREIYWNTAFLGRPGEELFEGREIFSDFMTGYFTDSEPEACFVAESGESVIGYLIGTKSEKTLEHVFIFKILPRVFLKAFFSGVFFHKKNLRLIMYSLTGFLKGEFRRPDFSHEYPAVLHINIEEGFRSSGVGAKLIAAFLEYLKKEKVPGVHLSTMSDKAALFFEKNAFRLLFRSKVTYFSSLLGKDVTAYVYGRKI
ncbi:MAG: GNAT family N-acetyltransferase [Candidatus Omnitrophica bacterium]|nr:GNAT family N-acetyltransferase [Candidatus Omnitrophota bacterium]